MDWIDRLRIALTILVVAHHAADTYATFSDWYLPESGHDSRAMALTVFMVVNQTFFMGAFFLLSGLFVPGSADRKGLARFSRDRLIRLGLPIVAYWLVIRPLCLVPAALYLHDRAASRGDSFSIARFLAFAGDPGVTWFLEVLLAFTLGYVVVRRITSRRTHETVEPAAPRFWMLVAFGMVLAITSFAWHLVTPPGSYWPIVGLPSPDYLPQYLMFFVAGVIVIRRGWLDRLPRWYAIPAVPAVLVGVLLYAPVAGTSVDIHHIPAGAAMAAGQTLFAMGVVLLLLLLFRRVFARPAGRATRFLADQALMVYVAHPAVLVAVAVALTPWHAAAVVKAGVLFAISAPMCWALAWLIRRIRVVRAVV